MSARTLTRLALCATLTTLGLALPPGLSTAATNHPLLGAITGDRIETGEQFKDACGVAVDSVGDVYVADYYQNRIDVFNKKKEFLTRILGVNTLDAQGVLPIDGPCDLAVDSGGRLYVNDYHRDVVRFTPAKFPPEQGTAYGPAVTIDANDSTGVAVDPANDHVYVNDRTYVAEYEPSGSQVFEGGEPVQIGLGSLGDSYGVAISTFPGTEGRLYVADAAGDSVKAYDPSGGGSPDPVEVIDGSGNPRAGFVSLVDSDLAVDPADGHLYVADNLQPHFESPEASVYEFSSGGHYRGQLPFPKTEGEPSFLDAPEPTGLAIAPGGDIYVTSGNYEDALVFIFGPAPVTATHLLSVAKAGAGSGTVASSPFGLRCGSACEGEFEAGSKVTLFAIPSRSSRLAGWSSCEEELAANSCTTTMAGDRAVTAEFEPAPQRKLTVAKVGTGSGTVASSPVGIDCGSACEGDFDEGSTVTLTAAAAASSRFVGWGGCDSEPGANSCRVAMSAARLVTAEFETLPEEEAGAGASLAGRAPIQLVSVDPAAASGALRIGKVVVKGATVALRVVVPGPGELSATGRGLRPRSIFALRVGEVPLSSRLNAAGRRALRDARRHKLDIDVNLAFAPLDEGAVQRAARKVSFMQPERRR
jgi:DNA-binding beta-propeller fold protein YncE